MNNSERKMRLLISINGMLVLAIAVLVLNKYGILKKPWRSYSFSDNPMYNTTLSVFLLNNTDAEIVFAGDSYTARSHFEELITRKVLNRGIEGDTTEGLLNRVDEIVSHNPCKVFIMMGINDIGYKISTEVSVRHYKEIIDEIHKYIPSCEIYIQSLLPVLDKKKNALINYFNYRLQQVARVANCKYVDLNTLFLDDSAEPILCYYDLDGLHINGRGYKVWLEALSDYIQ